MEEEDEDSPRSSIGLLFTVVLATALGIASALAWQYSGAKQWVLGFWSPAIAGLISPPPHNDLDRTVRELAASKKTIAELEAAKTQMAAEIVFLQASQQELQQRILALQLSSQWYANLANMKYRIVVTHRPSAGPTAPRDSSNRAKPLDSMRPREIAPLQLTPPRP